MNNLWMRRKYELMIELIDSIEEKNSLEHRFEDISSSSKWLNLILRTSSSTLFISSLYEWRKNLFDVLVIIVRWE